MTNNRIKSVSSKALLYIFLFVLIFVWCIPVLWLIGKAFTPNNLILREGGRIIPSTYSLENLRKVLRQWPFFRWVWNSIIVSSGAMIVTLIISILAAYSFARLKWKGRDVMFLLFLSSMFIPWEINVIPLYFIANALKLLNSHPGVFLPIASMPIGMFLLRQFFINIPQELEDAARIDGCKSLGLLFRIILPISKPVIGAVIIWIFIFSWNEFFWSMISLQRSKMLTLPIGLKTIMGSQNIEYGILFGSSLLALLPSLIVFLLLRKHIITGIKISGSIK